MTLPYRCTKGAAVPGRSWTTATSTDTLAARLEALDAGTSTPSPKDAIYLGNCPECRKAESPDSPHAFALRIGAVAPAVASALDLSPRQAAVLALSLAETELPDDGRKAFDAEPDRKLSPLALPAIPESERAAFRPPCGS